MTWSHSGDLFLLTNGAGRVKILNWPSLELLHTLYAHTSNCFSLEFDPRGRWVPLPLSIADFQRYLAVGGADAIISLWDLKEWICIRTFDRQEYQPLPSKMANGYSWPIRTLSFSYDGIYLASGSEDSAIDIVTNLRWQILITCRLMSRRVWKQERYQPRQQRIALLGILPNTGLLTLAKTRMDL